MNKENRGLDNGTNFGIDEKRVSINCPKCDCEIKIIVNTNKDNI
jgi:hypothetical protein